MGILSSFNIGVSGLHAAGSAMSVTGDNIANAGTFGFKGSRAEFQDLLSKSLKGIDGGDQIGSGTKLAHITPKFTQGNINRTESITDLAINGNGFFTLETPKGRGFTRDGSLHFDKVGQLINGDGYPVMGFQAGEDGKISQKMGKIKLGNTTIPAAPTKNITMSMNLDSRAEVQQFDITNPEKTSDFNTSIAVFDNVGTQRLITIYYNKAADGQWQYHGTIPGEDAQGGLPGTLVEMSTGTLQFDPNGKLQSETSSLNAFNFNKGAAPGQAIDLDFGKSITEGGTGDDATTQFGSKSSVARHTQDGASAATLSSLSFNDEGVLTAAYDNGTMRDVAQVSIAKFENNEGLFKMGKNLFKETRKSGQAAIGKPGRDGRGDVMAKSIELSNVDIADEFISLMNAQRNFQANTKTITTADQMLQEVLNIKR
ncbi:MAG: flagellar hook protein FlgE [Halobacteriovoraceae bacterium]|jgi:flagellar hook protein FlgE|nr:flagellar hook protein FlgE [Halobacteriovoraceae bacterium]